METKRGVPYGVINWAELVRECFVVDNTRYIRELEQIKTPVFLRPKRFGKSVVCSMLAHYYDINLTDRFEELFGRTDIGRNPTPLRNSFLVLQFDFSTVQVGTLAEIERNFWENVKGAVECFTVKYGKLAYWSKVGSPKSAMLVEFKYFTNATAEKGKIFGRTTPDAETVEQALAYRKALAHRPD